MTYPRQSLLYCEESNKVHITLQLSLSRILECSINAFLFLMLSRLTSSTFNSFSISQFSFLFPSIIFFLQLTISSITPLEYPIFSYVVLCFLEETQEYALFFLFYECCWASNDASARVCLLALVEWVRSLLLTVFFEWQLVIMCQGLGWDKGSRRQGIWDLLFERLLELLARMWSKALRFRALLVLRLAWLLVGVFISIQILNRYYKQLLSKYGREEYCSFIHVRLCLMKIVWYVREGQSLIT